MVTEEGGEVLQAALSVIERQEKFDREKTGMPLTALEASAQHEELADLEHHLMKEAAQTGAMALRFLMNFEPLYYVKGQS